MVQFNRRDITTTTNYTKSEHAIAQKQSQTCPLEKENTSLKLNTDLQCITSAGR